MATNNSNPLEELTNFMKMSADVLNTAVSGLPEDQKAQFNNELIKQGYDKKMNELRAQFTKLSDLSKKL